MLTINPIAMFVIFCLSLCVGQTLFAVVLLLRKECRQTGAANRFMIASIAAMCACVSLYYLFDFWLLYWPHLILSFLPILPVVPASLYLYAHFQTNPSKPIKPLIIAAHYSPCFIVLVAMLPFYGMSGIEKIEWYYFNQDTYIQKTQVQNYSYSVYACIKAFIMIQGLIYSAFILKVIHAHRKNIASEYSYYEGIDLKWLQYLAVVLITVYLSFPVARSLAHFLLKPQYFWVVSVCLWSLLIAVFGFFGVSQASVRPRVSANKFVSGDVCEAEEDAYEMQGVLLKAQEYLEKNKLYQDAKLSISGLASEMGVSVKALSHAINKYANANFMEFINRYRVEEATRLLLNKPDSPVLEIAFESGFNSKTTFYSVFKKMTRTTPLQYRRERLENL